jgi:hypothetical protein
MTACAIVRALSGDSAVAVMRIALADFDGDTWMDLLRLPKETSGTDLTTPVSTSSDFANRARCDVYRAMVASPEGKGSRTLPDAG